MGGYSNRGVGFAFHEKKVENNPPQGYFCTKLTQGGGNQGVVFPTGTPELAWKFEQMLMEYHNIFLLDKHEIGCTDVAEHIIELLDEEPCKEKF